jgi:hypothetical protein
MPDQLSPLERLYDLHTFAYEIQAFPHYTPVSKSSAIKNFPKIWYWIDAAMSETAGKEFYHGVKECLIFLIGEDEFPSVIAHTQRKPEFKKPSIETEEVTLNADPLVSLRSWLARESVPEISLKPQPTLHNVVSFYLLYKNTHSTEKPYRLADILDCRSYLMCEEALKEVRSGTLLTPEMALTAPQSNRKFYQRLCVIFGCRDEDSAIRLSAWSNQIVCGLITTWGSAVELAKERAQAAEQEAQAWSHEIGNFIRYLNWAYLENARHLYDLAQDFLEIGTRSAVKFQDLPALVKDWLEGMKADTMLDQAIELGAKFAVLRVYRGGTKGLNLSDIETEEGFNNKVKFFKTKFADFNLKEKRLRLTSQNGVKSIQRVASFAQFIIFALYSAARHSHQPESIEICLEKDWLEIKNRLTKPIVGNPPKGEVRAILHQAFQVLWESSRENEFKCEPEGDYWITAIPLPVNLWEEESWG